MATEKLGKTSRFNLTYLLIALQVVTGTFFEPARSAALPQLVPDRYLATANALGAVAWSVMFTLGAALAPGGTDSYTFSTTADLSAGTATIDARTQLGTDGNAANDELLGATFANDTIYTPPFGQ